MMKETADVSVRERECVCFFGVCLYDDAGRDDAFNNPNDFFSFLHHHHSFSSFLHPPFQILDSTVL
jgi:hypothetical protein